MKKTVKAADINMKVQDSYDFPFLGLKAVLPEELKKQIENSDMLMITEEEWNDDSTGFKYAFFHWNKLTEEQKNEDVTFLEPAMRTGSRASKELVHLVFTART